MKSAGRGKTSATWTGAEKSGGEQRPGKGRGGERLDKHSFRLKLFLLSRGRPFFSAPAIHLRGRRKMRKRRRRRERDGAGETGRRRTGRLALRAVHARIAYIRIGASIWERCPEVGEPARKIHFPARERLPLISEGRFRPVSRSPAVRRAPRGGYPIFQLIPAARASDGIAGELASSVWIRQIRDINSGRRDGSEGCVLNKVAR